MPINMNMFTWQTSGIIFPPPTVLALTAEITQMALQSSIMRKMYSCDVIGAPFSYNTCTTAYRGGSGLHISPAVVRQPITQMYRYFTRI